MKKLFCVRFVIAFTALDGLKVEGRIFPRPVKKETEKMIELGEGGKGYSDGVAFDFQDRINKKNIGKVFGEGKHSPEGTHNKIVRKIFCFESHIGIAKKEVREAAIKRFNEIQDDMDTVQNAITSYQQKMNGGQIEEGTF